MNSDKYWESREVKLREALFDRTEKEIDDKLYDYYLETAKDLTVKLQKLYIEIQSNPDVLDSHRFTYDKYYELSQLIQKEIVKLGRKEVKLLDKSFEKMYKSNVKILQGEGFPLGSSLNKPAINEVVNALWVSDKLTWSDRVWKNKAILEQTLKQGLFEVVATGRTPDDLIKTIMTKCRQNYDNAARLVRTELAHIQWQSTINQYKNADIKKIRWLTAKDERVCEICGPLDNKIFPITDKKHTNIQHPMCRCTCLAVIE